MVIVGVITYVVVFNLNNLVQSSSNWYDNLKRPWIKRMQNPFSSSDIWQARAENYSGFRHYRKSSKPSDWWIIWYIWSWPVRMMQYKLGQKMRKSELEPELEPYLRDFFPSLPDMVRKTELTDGWGNTMPSESVTQKEETTDSVEPSI